VTNGGRAEKLIDRFLFSEVPATALALLRIGTGALCVAWSVVWLGDSTGWLGQLRSIPEGVIGFWHPWPGAPSVAVQVMGVGLLVASLALTVGAHTRFAAWSAFGLMLVLQRYLIDSFNYGDLILRSILLLAVAIGPSGAYLSVDAFRRGWSWRAPHISVWSLRFVQLHISMGYILTVILKLSGEHWPGGTAVWYAMNLVDLARFPVPIWIIAPPVGAVLTWLTLAVELGVGVGVWFGRTRAAALIGGVLLHLGILMTMDIGPFSLVMLVSYLAWVPAVSDVRLLWRFPARLVAHGQLPLG
jgi:uncharacterized membrane protein YphA (DoxX/SURF4 family)